MISVDLSGKVALVTGGTRGIGEGCALALARCGADVAICSRHAADQEAVLAQVRALGVRSRGYECDVASLDSIRTMFEALERDFGRLDILVNNAGVTRPQPALEMDEAAWDYVLDVNLKGAFFVAQAAGRLMVRGGRGGKIINMSSVLSEVVLEKRANYAASKGGLRQVTRTLALEWARHGIQVNALGPTYVETPLVQRFLADPEFRADILRRIPAGRIALVDDIVGAVLFLASNAADMITGQTLLIDGGLTVI